MPCVFLSHSSADKPFVRRIAARLESHGIDVWIDEAEIGIGDSLIEKIGEAIHQVEFVAAFISRTSVLSSWVKKELSLAMTKEIKGRRVVVLPILIEPADLPFFLSDKLYADFTTSEKLERNFSRLLSTLLNHVPSGGDSAAPRDASARDGLSPTPPSVGARPLGTDRKSDAFFGFLSAKSNKSAGAALIGGGLFFMLVLTLLHGRVTDATKLAMFLTWNGMCITVLCGAFSIMSGIYFTVAYNHDANLLMDMEDIKDYLLPFDSKWRQQWRVGRHNKHHRHGLVLETIALILGYSASAFIIAGVFLTVRWALLHGRW